MAPYLRDGRLAVKCQVRVNGEPWLVDGDASAAYYTWGEIVQRASKDSRIAAGDVIGSGTVGGGSVREAIRKGYEAARFLEPGDAVELEVEGIGVLRNILGVKTPDPSYPFPPKSPTRSAGPRHASRLPLRTAAGVGYGAASADDRRPAIPKSPNRLFGKIWGRAGNFLRPPDVPVRPAKPVVVDPSAECPPFDLRVFSGKSPRGWFLPMRRGRI